MLPTADNKSQEKKEHEMNENMSPAKLRGEVFTAMKQLSEGEITIDEANAISDEANKILKIKQKETKELKAQLKKEKK
jgi:hypothetical protein